MLFLYFGGNGFSYGVPEYIFSASVLLILSTILLLKMITSEWMNQSVNAERCKSITLLISIVTHAFGVMFIFWLYVYLMIWVCNNYHY